MKSGITFEDAAAIISVTISDFKGCGRWPQQTVAANTLCDFKNVLASGQKNLWPTATKSSYLEIKWSAKQ